MIHKYDLVVVGGGAAGLSAALTLARARRSVLVIDDGSPRNAPAAHVHNYLGREGTPPGDLLATGRAEVAGYGGEFLTGRVISAQTLEGQDRVGHGMALRVTMADGTDVLARRLLATTGLIDELPDLPGVAERWGRDVLHCPYCHGWEIRDQALGVLATSPMAVHMAQLFRQWSADVTLFQHTAAAPSQDEREQLAARGIRIVEGEVAALEVTDDRLTGVRLQSGEFIARQAVVVMPLFTARADALSSLGLEPTEQEFGGHVIGSSVPSDPNGATDVPGVWVAGNVADPRAGVINAAAAGVSTAAAINADLIAEDTRDAVAAHRRLGEPVTSDVHENLVHQDHHDHSQGKSAMDLFDEQSWEERYRSREALWSTHPNPQLVTEGAHLRPGSALDVGCGEGADAVWLAARGWTVTAVDISTIALQRAAAQAEALGADIAGRIRWEHADLTSPANAGGSFDLVSAQFMHLPAAPRQALFARLADMVAPDGTLLIVGHHPSDMQTTMPRPPIPGMFYTAEEVAASLDPDQWDLVVAEARPRPATDPAGQTITIRDTVLRARRRRL